MGAAVAERCARRGSLCLILTPLHRVSRRTSARHPEFA